MKKIRVESILDGKMPTQAALARAMKIDVGSISRWERNDSSPSASHMSLWAMKLGVDEGVAMKALRGENVGNEPSVKPILITGDLAENLTAIADARGITPLELIEPLLREAARGWASVLPLEPQSEPSQLPAKSEPKQRSDPEKAKEKPGKPGSSRRVHA